MDACLSCGGSTDLHTRACPNRPRPQTSIETREENAAIRLAQLQKEYPNGHPDFLPITLNEIKLHSEKNHDYALGGPPLGNFNRVSQILALYPHLKPSDRRVVALTYLLKQLDAVLWGISEGIQQKVEGLLPRLGDISVYAKLVMCMVRDDKKAQ